jgi:hypothetical protein
MSDKILMITAPDDSYEEGIRIFVFDLTSDQYSILSQGLLDFDEIPSVVVYNASISTDIKWILDKIFKSDIIIFNAGSENQQLVGYLTSKSNSYYFGELRDLSLVNTSVILDTYQLKEILEKRFEKYGKF